jgi:hypothetical protein
MPRDGLGGIRGARLKPRNVGDDGAELPAATDGAFVLAGGL